MYAKSAVNKIAAELVRGELFDLSLYRALLERSRGRIRSLLEALIPVEERHLAFWREFFGLPAERLGLAGRAKLLLILGLCRLFGEASILLALEAIEIHGIRKYLRVWDQYKDGRLGGAVRKILEDEFDHEEAIIGKGEEGGRRVNPERIRNIFLGFNDGLVEILGAVSGLFAAFSNRQAVLIAALTLSFAGALSMAGSVLSSSNSEREMKMLARRKREVLGKTVPVEEEEKTVSSMLVVGISYLAGAVVPILPVLLGAPHFVLSLASAALVVVAVSAILSFLSGMEFRQRIVMNLAVVAISVTVTYAIGKLTNFIWGISV